MFTAAAEASEPARHGPAIKAFRRYAEDRIQRDPAPGLSIGFMFGTSTWADGFGYADVENEVPAKDVSAYRLASVTKPMTAMGALRLAQDGKLDLDAEVQTYVPYFPRKQWPVRVRQLLGHLGGISHYRNYDLEGHFKEHKNTRQSIAVFEDFDLVAEPGTRYNYSSYGYNLLGAVIEGASGEPYGDYMKRVLWEPLGMEDTRMDDPYVIIPNRVRGYQPGADGDVIPSEFVDISSRFAAGGTRSTVVDLLRFAEGLRDGNVLSPEMMDLMWTPMVTRDGRETGYGMGWGVRSVNGHFTVRHTGGQAETRTFFMYVPSEQLAIAAAMNYEGGGWQPYASLLYQLLMNEGYNPQVYATDDNEQRVHDAMQAVFDSGLPHYDRYGRAMTTEDSELDAAFRYVNGVLADAFNGDDREATARRIDEGRHPVAGSPLPIAGSFMGDVVARANPAALSGVHAGGALELFAAYIDAYENDADVAATRRFAPAIEQTIRTLREHWNRTWSNDSRQLAWPTYGTLSQLQPLLTKLERRFAGARIYPDFTDEISEFVTRQVVEEQGGAAVHAAEWARARYPRSMRARLDAVVAHLASANVDEARTQLAHVHAMEPEGAGSARDLNWRAYRLRGAGALEAGLALLDLARELHPTAANLYDSTGEFHLAAGRRDEAIAWYEKALEVDPEFENARSVLERLRAEPAALSER